MHLSKLSMATAICASTGSVWNESLSLRDEIVVLMIFGKVFENDLGVGRFSSEA